MTTECASESSIRKEIFEHLRNLQRAEEISAKHSGINIWVLWGALWFVAWKLFENSTLISAPIFLQASLSLILVSQAFLVMIQPNDSSEIGDEPRFLNFNALSVSETPVVLAISFLWTMVPATTYWLLFGFSFISGLLGGLIGGIFFYILLEAFKKKSRFPKPTFRSKSKKGIFILHFILAIACIGEIFKVLKIVTSFQAITIQASILLVVAFWLIYLLLEVQQKKFSDAWSYRTERELLLGFISTKEALRRIEHRYLGSRLSAVMDDYWRETSNQFESANALLKAFKDESAEIQKIPSEYTEERKTRFQKAAKPIRETLAKLLADIEECSDYTGQLLASQKASPDINVIEAIKNTMQQNRQAMDTLKTLSTEFENEKKSLGIA